jgi:hypothetical protein
MNVWIAAHGLTACYLVVVEVIGAPTYWQRVISALAEVAKLVH